MSSGIRINGLGALESQLKNLTKELSVDIDAEIKASCDTINRDQKRAAPVDQGFLRGGISNKKVKEMEYDLISSSPVSAYMEFGTGRKVIIPAGYEDFAAQFKGQKGPGTLAEMLQNLTDWVKSKGLAGTYSVKTQRRTGNATVKADEDRALAYIIMRSILRNGINPHPFFIPAIEAEKPKLLDRIKKLVTN